MAGVLITGFEPFGGEAVNPSWEVVKRLDGAIIGGQPVAARQLPCVFGDALTALNAALDELDPVLTLAIGQAGASTSPLNGWRSTSMMRGSLIIKACSRSTYRSLPAGRRRTSARCRSKRS